MGLHKHGGTMDGALTPICEECGVSLCWDLEENEALANEGFWNRWKCQDCNGGESMSLKKWKEQHLPFNTTYEPHPVVVSNSG